MGSASPVLAFAADFAGLDEDDLCALSSRVPPYRLEKVEGASFECRRRSLASWALLQHALVDAQAGGTFDDRLTRALVASLVASGARVEVSASGKPSFSDAPWLSFSISHAGSMALCALGTSAVGCDVERSERFRSPRPGFERRALHPCERDLLARVSEDRSALAACALWTAKESFGKLSGVGISYDMQAFDFSECARSLVCAHGEPPVSYVAGRRFRHAVHRGFVLTVCSAAPLESVRFLDARSLVEAPEALRMGRPHAGDPAGFRAEDSVGCILPD